MIHRYSVTIGGHDHDVELEFVDDADVRVVVDGKERHVDARQVQPGVWSMLEVGGTRSVTAEVAGDPPAVRVLLEQLVVDASIVDARSAKAAAVAHRTQGQGGGPAIIRSPMPGRIVKVHVTEGAEVAEGAGVVVVEAMKMENELRAPRAGTVKTVKCHEGDTVESGQELIVLA